MTRRYPSKAIREMEEALRFYAAGDWNDDYPGGINVSPDTSELDFGWRAKKALAHPAVKLAVSNAKDEA